jgi:hypothetical protein
MIHIILFTVTWYDFLYNHFNVSINKSNNIIILSLIIFYLNLYKYELFLNFTAPHNYHVFDCARRTERQRFFFASQWTTLLRWIPPQPNLSSDRHLLLVQLPSESATYIERGHRPVVARGGQTKNHTHPSRWPNQPNKHDVSRPI